MQVMDKYRLLTYGEIQALENHGCTAEDWACVHVAEDFSPDHLHDVRFYGDICLGVFDKDIEVSRGFMRHSGIRNATLRNVTVGDNSLIENIGNYVNNYIIGEECLISNVSIIETTDGATFGEGISVSVLNEAGSGNVILYSGLIANMAALMVRHSHDRGFIAAVRSAVRADIAERVPDMGTIGNRVKIVNTTEITNTHIADDCEVNGACRLSDCTVTAGYDDSVYIGSGVICESSIIADGSAVLNSAKLDRCYVGECSQVTNGFAAESSLFFANCYMSNGEACAAFCGPFSVSHHKSTLLIGGMFSFYNAGSATNFSNHAYKMGPIHYGILERGCKTASGSHILMPARIGSFSMCMGKIETHPDTTQMPFSYVIADGRETVLVPARNIATAGLYRDVRKWPHRDVRPLHGRKSIVNCQWLNPVTINGAVKGLAELRRLQEQNGEEALSYTYNGCRISRSALLRGISYYTMVIEMFVGGVLKKAEHMGTDSLNSLPDSAGHAGEWTDLAGLLMPVSEEQKIVDGVKSGQLDNIHLLTDRLTACGGSYDSWLMDFTLELVRSRSGQPVLTAEDVTTAVAVGDAARRKWLGEIKRDAEKEYGMCDVEQDVLDKFLAQLDAELREEHTA